jgi:glycosyltransferase involved in cell wall biosynthesis
MAAIVGKFQVGDITTSLEPAFLAAKINEALENTEKRKYWLSNLPKAAAELNWENEEKIIRKIFSSILGQ